MEEFNLDAFESYAKIVVVEWIREERTDGIYGQENMVAMTEVSPYALKDVAHRENDCSC